MKVEFEHKKSSLMSRTKEDLAEQIMRLEHNVNVLHDTIDQQAKNFVLLERQAVEEFAGRAVEQLEEYVRESGNVDYNRAMMEAIEIIKAEMEG